MSKTESPFRTLADARAHNTAQGLHFFDRGTMKFWKSRIESTLIRGRYFITSEAPFELGGRTARRIYAVRYANNDGTIKTLASFLRSKDEARGFIRQAIAGREVNF